MDKNLINSLKNYKKEYLPRDLTAAISVLVIALPQNMAYALIAGLNPIYGLYTYVVSSIINFFVTSSSYLIVGPTNIIALALASTLGKFDIAGPDQYLQYIVLLTFLVGMIQLILGLLKFGKLVTFVSHPVIIGLTTGIAVVIAVGQLDELLGLAKPDRFNVILDLYTIIRNISGINFFAVGFGVLTFFIVIFIDNYFEYIPAYLVGVMIPVIILTFFNLQGEVATVGSIDSAIPQFRLVKFDLPVMAKMLSSAFSIIILCFIQLISIIKMFEKKTGQEIDMSREICSQGIINMTASFFSSFVITGSITNSFANLQSEAKTRFAGLFASIIVLIVLYLFSGFISLIPIPSLAAIVILVAYFMIDKQEIKTLIKTTRSDMFVLLSTFLATISQPRLDYAIGFGVVISIVFVVRNTGNINSSYIKHDEDSTHNFQEKDEKKAKEDDEVTIINLMGDLHFHTLDDLQKELNRNIQQGEKYLIRLRHVENIDVTILQELEDFIDIIRSKDGQVMLSGIEPEIYSILKQYGIIDKIGEKNCFSSKGEFYDSTEHALNKLKDEK
ncbi:MAG: SulP family inorganic anion transporter [bacterium]